MSVQSDRMQKTKFDIVDLLERKESVEWSSTSQSKATAFTVNRSTNLKTLPQAHFHEMEKVEAALKATLPMLTPAEVRRYQKPYHEAIILELEEEGYEEAGYYLKELLDFDEKIARQAPGTLMWKKPYLKDRKDFIDQLRQGLISYEIAKRIEDHVNRAMALLDTALFFESQTWEWWWLAERLYQGALSAAEFIEDDNRQTITLIRYLYGRFLFHELKNPEEALNYLNDAREASERRTWNASKKLGEKQTTIFKECNTLLYKALIIICRKIHCTDPQLALKTCTEALERATDADQDTYIAEALYELGKCYLRVDDVKRALQTFSKLLAMARRIPDPEGICNAHMELAFAYKQLNDDFNTEKHLRLFRENATDFNFVEKLAHAHYYTGEHYLSQGKSDLSTVHLETALDLYNRCNLSDEADRARNIAGISKGQEKLEYYIVLLSQCGAKDVDATLKLCRWKDRRRIFWTKEKPVHDRLSEVTYENSESSTSPSLSTLKDD